MARVRTVDFLPEIFQTSTNRQFLSATLDQLVQEPAYKKIQGFVGRRTGPGVNPNESYVAETSATRANYQLEPGVVVKESDNTSKIKNAITYPGITDALSLQGANVERADRLYTSDYYTWDPFVDFDKFVNFGQYYWLPAGPESVNVFSGTVPLTDNFTVTRENGVYTFSGVAGENPAITLVRGGNYTFQVAQNQKETVNYRVTNQGTSAYVIDYQNNPTLTLVRGNTYVFNLVLKGDFPFYIKTQPSLTKNNVYDNGVTNNGASEGLITFTVPQDAPDTLYYANPVQPNMQGVLNIIDGTSGTGPGFWIQTDPGVNGRIPSTPNISSRDVLGVINNGEDLGTVTFNVPLATAQNFYYTLDQVSPVDLITDLKFNQINNQYVEVFLAQYGGIDGISALDGKTVVFLNETVDAQDGGWQRTTQFDPVSPGVANAGLPGTYDTTLFDQTTDILPDQRYTVWQIRYVTTDDGSQYINLVSVRNVEQLQKFSILYGTTYSSTQWYKSAEGYFEQIPLLTAVKDVLYYQDGTDPGIFGRFKLINQDQADTLDISDILGKKTYTSPNGVAFTNGLKVQFVGQVNPASYQNQEYYVEGVGTAIRLLPVSNYVTPETYTKSSTVPYDSTGYDIGNYDASLNQPLIPDYITINKASPDLNAWTRSNRWTHIDVINATAEYNNTVAVIDNAFRAKRPILEFRAGLRLYDFGTQGKNPVDIIDFQTTDALSNINGTVGYGVDGYSFISGTRVIFAADQDPQVRNKIYTVEFITPDSVNPLIAQPIINLVPASDANVSIDQTVVCLSGITQQGKSFYFDGVAWLPAQLKTGVNQAPLFNIYDQAGISLGDRIKYPSTSFRGNKLFSYKQSAGPVDQVLGFSLSYLSLANVGDIVFENNLYTDTFIYTKDSISTTENVSVGVVREYLDRIVYSDRLGWDRAITKSITRQQFRFEYDGRPLTLDIKALMDLAIPGVQIYVGSKFVEPNSYTVQTTSNSTTITLSNVYVPGDIIEVNVISDQASKIGFYQVPVNLENNPLNENSSTFTLGTVRSHYETIGENLKDISGPINGANNTRDLGNIGRYGTNILQQSSPLTMAGYFMRSTDYNIFSALEYNSREYEKFKAQLMDTVVRNDYTNYTIPDMLTAAISDITTGRTNVNPFYWTDMLPASSVYTELTTTITPISTNEFDLTTTYDFNSSNYQSVLVYVNDVLLTYGYDYTVATDAPRLTITSPLAVGDVVNIQEYGFTYGSFVPNTPTKLGLYPAFKPQLYLDTTYVNPTLVIQGHDGSKTIAFGDFRDQLLLEFEKRIFNNLKIKSEIPLPATEVIPGQFRTTDYTLSEVNEILSLDFLSWVGWNKLDYKNQAFDATNEFTWNYSASGNKLTSVNDNSLTDKPLSIGAWRGIYRYFYDTDYPDTRPWEMLGFSQSPTWWEDVYGPAPYTSDNLVLWDDLAQGRVADPAGEYFLPQFARPRLQEVIPTGTEGQLISPFDSVVGYYDSSSFQKSWVFGDGGPVEATWFKSSSYPFAIMRLLALTRPAEFFSLFADRDLYKFNSEYNQYLYNNRYRLDANGVEVYGNGVSKASFIDWIIDYNQQLGRNSSDRLSEELRNLDVRLCYRMGSFTDKQYLKIYTEKSSPNSLNSSLLLPDESYNLLVYKNQPFERIVYSSVIVQQVNDGYAVYGYSITQPFFNILASRTAGTKTTIEAGGSAVTVPNEYTSDVVQVPYGYVFANRTVVVDFLLSYGALLADQGLVFDDRENGRSLNWNQMAQEFLYWSNQGWDTGSVINLNPTAYSLTAITPQAVVDTVIAQTPENLILDQNRTTLPVRDLVVDRYENVFKISSLSQQTISYLDLKFTSYESMVVLDNVSIFNDLIYDPVTGARQSRINVSAAVSADWNGQLDAQGFILNDNNTVRQWQPNQKYAKGEIVLYKNNYWSAQTIVQPSVEFKYGDWVKSDYTKIQRGLLENIPNKADQLANSYSTDSANLESDQDLLSYGLIGFRPREYMSSLNLDDVSQVNVYKQFLKNKGTIESVRLLGNANLGKEVAEYDVFENWAVQRATYGANANRSFFELRLNEALLQSDPAVVQIVQPQQTSDADQTILLSDIWRQSYKLPNTDILPTTYATPTDTALPSAGYVNIDDVDLTVFSLTGNLGITPAVLDTIGTGTTIWAAKSNSYDWNIYRCSNVPGFVRSVSSNLNATSTVTFSVAHNLSVDNIIVIRLLDPRVDGVYRVLGIPDLTSVVIELQIGNTNGGNIVGNGVAYFLQTMRVAQASDAANLPYVNELTSGARVWVDNDGTGHWQVIEKQQPFTANYVINPTAPIVNSQFGASVAQGQNNIIALIGSPGYSSTGAVYPYVRNVDSQYAQSSILTLNSTAVVGYGNAVDIGSQNWCVAGASQSNSNQGYASVIYRAENSNAFEQSQLLVSPDADFGSERFGSAVSISQDERWLYVGAPGKNKVHAYGRIDVPEQAVRYTTNGLNRIFSYNENIEISNDQQINVVLNNRLLTYNVDYTVTSISVVLTDIPPPGQTLIISRKTGQKLDSEVYYNVVQNATSGSGTGAKFTVDRTRGTYSVSLTAAGINYSVGNTLTINAATIGGGSSPANNLVITVTGVNSGGITAFTFTGSGVSNTSSFNLAPYLYSATNIFSFTITVDGILQRPFIDYSFAGTTLTFINNPAAGASISAFAKTYFKYVSTLTVAGLPGASNFGASIASSTDGRQIAIGCPNATVNGNTNAGSVYIFDRSVTKYIVDNVDQLTYSIPTAAVNPVVVLLNGTFLTDQAEYINGQYSVDLGNHTITLDSSVTLQVGDIIEIESNIFRLVQQINANAPFGAANFGSAVDVCPNNCSVYIGAPNDGTVMSGAGSVDRRANQSRIYGIITSTNANPTLTAGNTIRINNFEVAVPNSPNNNVAGLRSAIVAAGIPNVTASVANGKITISVVNVEAADEFNRLTVLPGVTGTAFSDLGFDSYAYTQTIVSPNPVVSAGFGSAVFIDSEADNLVVGAPRGDVYQPVTFDLNRTYFDDRSTVFSSTEVQSGVVYTFDYLPSAEDSIASPGQFIFGQQIYDDNVKPLDQWGTAVSYVNGRLLVGSPGSDLQDSTLSNFNYGRVAVFNNFERKPAWAVIHQQQPVVDVYLLNSVYMYNQLLSDKTYFFDFFNPLQGKILGVARQNINYISTVDPAKYNVGTVNNNGNFWADNNVGEIWWDITSVRFIDPNQDDITYASRRWGQVFPGSRVEIYQWVKSDVPPAQYTGPGTPYSFDSYTVNTSLTAQGIFATQYYFWVTGIDTIATESGKTLSTTGIARYIESPRSSGVPYIAALNANTIAIYNGLEYLSAQDTIIHVEYDREYTTDNIHVEYELIAQDRPDSFLSSGLYRKLQDSFCGVNTTGALVPDPTLSPPERYGVQFRPRQSMFADRFAALENYLVRANNILKNFPIVETRRFTLLNSQEPEPTVASGEWNMRLENIEQLGYQDLAEVPVGYKYLIVSDSTNSGLWTIYTVVTSVLPGAPKTTQLSRVQTYDTRRYWYHIDWYEPGYNSSIVPIVEVPVYSLLDTLTLGQAPVGSSVKVTRNAQGKFEIYLRTDIGWNRVGLQDGTIQFSEDLWNYSVGRFGFDVEVFDAQYFDQEPTIETRKIIQAINEELFVEELQIERNRTLILMFNFILSEFTNPEWLVKTSLIDVEHRIRELVPFQVFRQDNQEFVLDYIQEVKPYHVQIREFNLAYNGFDIYQGTMTDFDNPAYYNTDLLIPQFVSPILLPYTQSTAVGTGTPSSISDTPANADIWDQLPWNQWFNNYLLSIQDVIVVDGGRGYTEPPEVVVTGNAVVPAEMEAVVNTAGQVIGINVINPGAGYSSTAVITFVGGNGTGARAVAVMSNDLVRSLKTVIKYDRYQYTSNVVDWQANVVYNTGEQVRYFDQVWSANGSVQGPVFDPQQWTLVNPASLSGVDRTFGLYAPGPNEVGRDLPLLIDGIDYPGVQVFGPLFSQNTGYDVGNYDINPYDNISFGPEGRPTYDPKILNAIYESSYLDIYLGTRPTDVNVDGGEYVDTYSSHAPEELVPGAEFDTLDLRVYTRPGSDWSGDGHGFAEYSQNFTVDELPAVYNFSSWYNFVPYFVTMTLFNQTTGVELLPEINYTVDWVAQTITVQSGINVGNILSGTGYALGGGNQLFREKYTGGDLDSVVIPVQYNQISEVVVWVNGELYTGVSYAQSANNTTTVTFDTTFTSNDSIVLYAFGPTTVGNTTVDYSWSAPVIQYIVGDGNLSFTLENSLEYTNPVNMIVNVNGVRARTAAGRKHIGDGSSAYLLPERLGFSQAIIADPEVLVYVDDIPQTLGVDYFVEPFDGTPRAVEFAVTPAIGQQILVAVTTRTQCYINGDQLVFNPTQGLIPVDGDIISVTTWNDTRQQDILTEVFVGPISTGATVTEGYDDTDFDAGNVSGEPGSFDYTEGIVVTVNDLQLNRVITDPSRLWVTVNGDRLFYGSGFTINNEELILATGILSPLDVVMITELTNSTVPDAMAFRIFQDMRGVQATYRITAKTTTTLTQPLGQYDDIMYVDNASALDIPDLERNIWGVFTVNGERIMYRDIDYTLNTVSGLRRGTAGTGATNHAVDSFVYNLGRGNLMPEEFQNYVDGNTFVGDGSSTEFNTDIMIDNRPLIYVGGSVEVRLNGVLQDSDTYAVTSVEPVIVEFTDSIPTAGTIVRITVIDTLSASTTQTFTATGSSNKFSTTIDIGLVEQPTSAYVVDNFEPVTVTFNTPVPTGRVVYITTTDNTTKFNYSFSDGVDATFASDIDLAQPIRVFVAGVQQTNNVDYTVTALDPVSVVFVDAVPSGQEVEILVRKGVNWYQPGINTPSNGVALQDTNTQAARFLRGL
ncbi:hypothetical protein UFOVP328_225 [uncultured Caudovirales phage]|uniref:Uncharacterized protein n=1 Tax=uncultured Caudovirales phage TaxID=2100421 RepID=A0A6J5LW31_9CAUD|nr:hypothetical protein UFOVP328_225 [uncultured Caudovirales phage]